MAWGGWVLRLSLFANVTLVITLLSILNPSVLQQTADRVVFWQSDPELALWEFYGIVFLATAFVGWLVGRSMSGTSLESVFHS